MALSLCFSSCFSYAVTLEWDRNPETNVIGYRVYVGRLSRAYDSVLDIGNQATAEIPTTPGTSYFAVTAYDSDGLESDFSVEVSYRAPSVNIPPDAQTDLYSTLKNSPLAVSAAFGVFANDTDADGDVLEALLLSGPLNGAVTLNPDGSFVYTPTADFTGSDSFEYYAYDGIDLSLDTFVIINVTEPEPPNSVPVAQADAYATVKNTTLNVVTASGVLANDSDADGDPLTAALVTSPTHGTVTLNANGSFQYSPTANYVGSDTFGYRANDGTANSATATVTITISAGNSAPVAQADSYTTIKNTALNVSAVSGVLANDTDSNGDTLTATLINSPSHGTVTLNSNGSFSYTPTANYTGNDTFRYRANDGAANSATVTVTLTINPPPNVAPVAQADSYSATKNITLTVNIASGVLANDTDADGNTLSASLVTSPTHGTLTLNLNGSFNYTPAANYVGADAFSYRANDGVANSATATVTLTIDPPPNSAPIALSDSYSIRKNATLTVNTASGVLANDTDADANALTASLVTSPAHGTVTLNANGSFTYAPAASYTGSDTFGYRANDGTTNSATAIVTIAITNTSPIARVNSYTTTKNTPLNVAVALGVLADDTDADGDSLTATIVASPTHGTISLNANGSLLYTPTVGYSGSDSFGYRASDGSATSNATVTITVMNTAPTAQADAYIIAKNTTLSVAANSGLLVNDADANGDSLTAVLVTSPTHGILTLNADGSFLYTPAANYTGSDTFTYRASDGSATANAAVAITVLNTTPVAQGDSYVTTMNNALTAAAPGVLANDTDANGDSLTASVVNSPSHGSVTLNANGSFLYTPVAGFTGTDTFSYRASDGSAFSATALVAITVSAAPHTNSPPISQPDAYVTVRNVTLNVSSASGVLRNDLDIDGDSLGATLMTSPSHGTVTLDEAGGFSYTPATGFIGVDTFEYLANDGNAVSPATVTIAIVAAPPVNVPPSTLTDSYTTIKNTALNRSWAFGVLANDLDADGDALEVVLMSAPLHGTVNLNSDGAFVYTPAIDFVGADRFEYVAYDGIEISAETTVNISVTQPDPVNTPPETQPENYSTSKNTPLNVPATSGLLLNDSDADGDTLTAILVIATTHGSLVLNPNGGFLYTPNTDFTGTDSFVYQASDGAASSVTRLVTINVTAASYDPTSCSTCFAALDEVLAARSNAFAPAIAAKLAVPTNATCPQYHVLVFRTLSKILGVLHDNLANQVLGLSTECVVSELQEEFTARSTDTAALAPSKWTTSASNYISVGAQNLQLALTSTDNSSRAKYLAAAVTALVRADRAITNGNLSPKSLAGRSMECLLTESGSRPFQATISFGAGSFIFTGTDGTPASGTYSFTRTAYDQGSLSLHFDTYQPNEFTTFALKFTRSRNRITGTKMRGYFTLQ